MTICDLKYMILYITLDIKTDAVNKGKSVDLVLLDFAKTFDKVSHEKILLKLEAYGIDSILVSWVKGFLSNRRQRVVIGDSSSKWVEVTPIDFKLIGVIENEGDLEQIQWDIDKLQRWAKIWQMSFNYDKCKVMHFG